MKKKILILGGYGFMGTNLNKVFKDDYEVFNESRQTYCDMSHPLQLTSVIKEINPDFIIHCAAHVGSISYVIDNAADVIYDNSQMYLNLYNAIRLVNKNITVINPISNCSYPGIIDIQDEELWWNGQIHPSVESYGTPKKLGYILSECYRKQYGIKTINLIIPNSYGEYDHVDPQRTHAMSGMIMRMIKSKKNNDKEFIVWGTGSPIREWIYMEDVGRIMKEIINNYYNYNNLPNPINLGQENGISIKDTAILLKKLVGYDGEIIFDTTKEDGAPIKVLGSKLFNKFFPNFKFTDYETGIKNAIKYYNEKI